MSTASVGQGSPLQQTDSKLFKTVQLSLQEVSRKEISSITGKLLKKFSGSTTVPLNRMTLRSAHVLGAQFVLRQSNSQVAFDEDETLQRKGCSASRCLPAQARGR